MDQIKVAADLSKEATIAQDSTKADDVRTLSDLEMVMCGGGDGVVCW